MAAMSKKPDCCEDCGAKNPYLVNDPEPDFDTVGPTGIDHWVCQHRYACEARQMLSAGESVEQAAAHAQQRLGGGFLEWGAI